MLKLLFWIGIGAPAICRIQKVNFRNSFDKVLIEQFSAPKIKDEEGCGHL